ncbi:MAG TPA: protein kinase [Clostridia bacterium]|jgi:serine/threonine-protein kinase|nr:protein kinase [Clostridia bacterium]HQO56048.1 protein kinase [Clostridia bacterium]
MIGVLLMGRYRLEERIGEGGMAAVYRALDLRTGHRVAVKFLRQELQANQEFLDRFRREATAASRMSHHNIVNLLDIGDNPSAPYLVFEFVDGKTLKEIIAEHGKLPQGTAVQIAIRILSALRHAHEAGVIHRDIKPQNVLVDRQGYIKVSDFGIARMVDTNTQDGESRQSVMGSVHYFSPEQARGETATAASDLYSVGCVLYEMLTGRMPFEGETQVSLAMQHLQAEPRPVRELAPEVSAAVAAVVHKALAKDPAARYPSALLMAQALHDALLPEKDNKLATMSDFRRKPRPKIRMRTRHTLLTGVFVTLLAIVLLLGVFGGAYLIYRDVVNTTRTPLLTGYLLEAAIREAEQDGIIIRVARNPSDEPVDTVIDQSYDVGTPIKRGDVLLLVVSSGPARKPVPGLLGKTVSVAKSQLERIALEILVIKELINPAPKGTVLSQEPQEGTVVDAGSIVQLVISAGQTVVPELSGRVWTETADILRKVKLVQGKVSEIETEDVTQHGKVASQLPVAGEKVGENTPVDLAVYVAPAQPSPNPKDEGGS